MNARPTVPTVPPPPPLGYFSLLPSCAILGLVGGWLAADALELRGEQAIRWLLIIVTPVVSAGLGHFLSSRVRKGLLSTLVTVVASVVVAGIINGVLVGFFIAPPIGMIFGLIFGMICCLPFIPAIGVVALMARRVGRARFLSIVDLADRRAVWLTTWVVMAVASAVPVPGISRYGAGTAVFPLVSAAFILILLALDLGALLQTGAFRARLRGARPATPEADDGAGENAVPRVDFGFGDEDLVEIAPPGAVYRDRERPLRRFRGSIEKARAALGWAIFADVAALVAVAGCALYRAHDLLNLPGGIVPSESNVWL